MTFVELAFDRGTICLGGRIPFPSAVWDERTGGFRAAAYLYGSLLEHARRAGIDVTDRLASVPGEGIRGWTRPPLRPYQENALRAWSAFDRRGVLVLPTGSGKTRLALAALADAGIPALILVPTRALLEQWERQMRQWYEGPIGVVGDGACRGEPVTIMTFESAYRRLDTFGDRFGALVVDEVHHFSSGARAEALEMCVARVRLGLTATAPPQNSAGAERLEALVGPVAYDVSLGELVGVHLSEFDVITLHVSLTQSESDAYEKLTRPFLELRRAHRRAYPGADWASTVSAVARGRKGREKISDFYRGCALAAFPDAKRLLLARLVGQHRDDRALIFTARAEDAYAISSAHLIPVVTSETKRGERKEILERFEQGVYRSLVSARVLNEGIDVPEARVAVVVSGSLGVREHIRRIGRVLRPLAGKRALVYELVTRGTLDDHRAEQRRRDLASRIAARL